MVQRRLWKKWILSSRMATEPVTDMSGNHNDFPVNISTFVGLDKAKKYGGRYQYTIDAGGRQILGGWNNFREDPYKET